MSRQKEIVAASVVGIASAVALASVLILRRNKKQDKGDDDDANDTIELTTLEDRLVRMGTVPISTLTWFEGNHQEAARVLKDRVECILKANPWLLGRLVKRHGKHHILQPAELPFPLLDGIFSHLQGNESPVHREIPLVDLASAVQSTCAKRSLILTMGGEYSEPFWKVSILPCCKSPTTHFCILVSMSHVIGDGHTFYTLHNMVLGADPVRVLEATRIGTTLQQQEIALGKAEAGVMYSVGLIVAAVRGIVMSKAIAPIFGTSFRPTARYFLIDSEKVDELKAQTGKTDGVSFVSTNDVVSSWFLSNSKCSQGLMAVNFRNRFEGHTDNHAGNYENCIYYRNTVDTSSPSLIRQSVLRLKRAVTALRPFSNLEFAANHFSLVTNWASFHRSKVDIEGCKECVHLPMYDMAAVSPATMATCLIFRARPDQLAVIVSGTPEKMVGLSLAPFESEQPFA